MASVLLMLVIAHLLGDFYLQPDAWVEQRRQPATRWRGLLPHTLTHAGLLVAVGVATHAWAAPQTPLWATLVVLPSLVVAHLGIDRLKCWIEDAKHQGSPSRNGGKRFRIWLKAHGFWVDQALHLASLTLAWALLGLLGGQGACVLWHSDPPSSILVAVVGFLMVGKAAGFGVKAFMAGFRFTPPVLEQGNEVDQGGLPKAGFWIGVLERWAIYVLILVGAWGAVGLVAAAKALLRVGDLQAASKLDSDRPRLMTEYVLVGSLVSWLIAIVSGLGARWALGLSLQASI